MAALPKIAFTFAAIGSLWATVDSQPAVAHEADQYLVMICSADVTDCDNQKAAFRKLYKQAFKKNLDAQRKIAEILWRGGPVTISNPIDGCAWHMAILAFSSPKLNTTDFSDMRLNCSLLTRDEFGVAKVRASDIGHRIMAGGKIDETIIVEKPDPTLDGAAENLP